MVVVVVVPRPRADLVHLLREHVCSHNMSQPHAPCAVRVTVGSTPAHRESHTGGPNTMQLTFASCSTQNSTQTRIATESKQTSNRISGRQHVAHSKFIAARVTYAACGPRPT